MNIFEKIQINKGLYQDELEFKTKLDGRLSINLTILTITGAGILTVVENIFPISLTPLSIINCLLCLTSIITFINCCVRFVKAYYKYQYHYVYLSEINAGNRQYKFQLLNECIKSDEEQIEIWVEDSLYENISDNYFRAAIHNRETNLTKAFNLKKLIDATLLNFIIISINFLYQIILKHIMEGDVFCE